MLRFARNLVIRSERRLCEELHLNLAYRWFCSLDLNDRVPDHSTFSKNRHGRFRESELLRHLFETTVARCIEEGLVPPAAIPMRRRRLWKQQPARTGKCAFCGLVQPMTVKGKVRRKARTRGGTDGPLQITRPIDPGVKSRLDTAVIVGAHDTGPLIRSKDGFWQAFPLPAAGKSTRGGRITPGECPGTPSNRASKAPHGTHAPVIGCGPISARIRPLSAASGIGFAWRT